MFKNEETEAQRGKLWLQTSPKGKWYQGLNQIHLTKFVARMYTLMILQKLSQGHQLQVNANALQDVRYSAKTIPFQYPIVLSAFIEQ